MPIPVSDRAGRAFDVFFKEDFLTKLDVISREGKGGGGPKPGVVASTCAILRFLADVEHPVGVNAIARELSLAPSSCFKILKSLQAEDYVHFDERSKGYSLGAGLATLSRRALDPTNAYDTLRQDLESVAERQSIAIGFWRLVPKQRIILAGFAEGSSKMTLRMNVGQRLPRLIGGVGRAIAADLGLTPHEIREEFAGLKWYANPDFDDYIADVGNARRLGYGLDQGHFAPGVSSVATTIRDDTGAIRFAISGIMFNGQHDEEAVDRIGKALIALADIAAVRLGLRRNG